jgi:hypothetical protein
MQLDAYQPGRIDGSTKFVIKFGLIPPQTGLHRQHIFNRYIVLATVGISADDLWQ